MNATGHEQNHAIGLEKGRAEDERPGDGWDVLAISINDEEFVIPIRSDQLAAMIAANGFGTAPDPCFDDIKLWIDRHWEDVQDCLDAIAETKQERMDQIRRAAVALAQWQLWRKPEKPSERFPKEYCEIVGIDNTATYLDACRQIEEDLEELEKHFAMVPSYERCIGDPIYDDDGNIRSRCWYNPQ